MLEKAHAVKACSTALKKKICQRELKQKCIAYNSNTLLVPSIVI